MTQRKHRSREEWRSLIDQQQASGLTVQAFCKTHHLSTSNFYNWKSTLKSKPSAFTKLDVVSPPKTRGLIRCLLPSGIELEWNDDVAPDSIASVCKALL